MRDIANLTDLVTRARLRSLPILGITTQDPTVPMALVTEASRQAVPEAPAVFWDSARGLMGLGEAGRRLLQGLGAAGTLQPADALSALLRLPENGLAFFLNAHRHLDQADVAQAIWNLREPFKADGRMLVLLAPHLQLPPELMQDVLVVEEPLPGEAELAQVVEATYGNAGLEPPDRESRDRCVRACRGLSAFASEQALALSLRKAGMDLPELWRRKKQAVEQTRGLTFGIDGPGFESLGGLEQVKLLGEGLFTGPLPPRCVVRIDEIEKQLAGMAGDPSGVSQDFNAVLLRYMQDYNWSGIIAVGPPGSGKSAFSKCLGGQFQVPTLEIDLGAAKGTLVGESEANIRAIMRVIHSLAGPDGAFFVATANSITALPPELRRRFRYGAYLFDLPTAEEREPIWRMYLRSFGIGQEDPRPEDSLWTGSDIYNCCELAYRLDVSLREAAGRLLPVSQSAPDQIRSLRELADGRFLSASYAGPYRKPDDPITPAPPGGRRIGLG